MGAAAVGRPVDCTRALVGRQCRRTYRSDRFLLSSVLTFTSDSEEKGMAARAKKSRGKSGSKSTGKRGGSKRGRSASARKSSAKRGPAVKRRSSTAKSAKKKRPTAKKTMRGKTSGTARGGSAAPKRSRKSPISRVTRVAREIGEQATTAVSEGVDAIKEIGETLVDRVTG